MAIALLATMMMAVMNPADPALASLRPGEVSLHIVAHGKARGPADTITLTIPINAEAATSAAARADATAKIARLTAALAARGIDRSAISTQQGFSPGLGFIGNEADEDQGGGGEAVSALISSAAAMRGAPAKRQATVTMKVRLTGRDQLDKATSALDAQDEAMAGVPIAAVADPRPLERAAVADALAKARGQAEDYAASLGMRIARIAAVSNAPAATDIVAFTQAMSAMQGGRSFDQVEMTATAIVDYVLVKP